MAEAAIEQDRVGGVDPLRAETSIFISFTDFRETIFKEKTNRLLLDLFL